jgi:hypothetical protein
VPGYTAVHLRKGSTGNRARYSNASALLGRNSVLKSLTLQAAKRLDQCDHLADTHVMAQLGHDKRALAARDFGV